MAPLLLVAVVMLGPLVPRSTEGALKLAAFINDEVALTMNLHAMTLTPIGDPYNLDGANPRRKQSPGPEWSGISYSGFNYYGGFYLGVGFLAYAPLKLLGAPIFPTAPVILRVISLLAALGSLLLIFHFGRKHAGTVTGLAAAVVLLTDSQFLYYASIIHPDMLQLFIGLAALILASRHVSDRSIRSLIALGLVMGISQSTKVGAIWFLPTAGLAVYWGLPAVLSGWRGRLIEYVKRMLILGAVAIFAWVLTTPYIVFGNYLTMMTGTWKVVTTSYFGVGHISDWFTAFRSQFGWGLTLVMIGGTVWVAFKGMTGRADKALLLAVVLSVSQFAWFSLTNKVWVILGYCMLAYGLMAIFGAILVLDAFKALRRVNPRLMRASLVLASLALLPVLVERSIILVNYILAEHLRDNKTSVALNDWALAQKIPANSKVIWDDIAYVDPSRFPNARMHGGLMTWSALRRLEPDYVILSSSIYASAWYAKLIAEQALERTDPFTYNVRLYQDFLGTKTGSRPSNAWIEYVHSIDPTPVDAPEPPNWLDRIRDGMPIIGPSLAHMIKGIYSQFARTQTLIENLTGQRQDLIGVSLRVFRLRPAIDACGREHSVTTSGTAPGFVTGSAFDGAPTTMWVSQAIGKAAENTSIAMDFGCGTEMGGETIDIRWVSEHLTPRRFSIEASQNGKEWTALGQFSASQTAFEAGKAVSYKLLQPMRARYWRLTAVEVADGQPYGLADILLPE